MLNRIERKCFMLSFCAAVAACGDGSTPASAPPLLGAGEVASCHGVTPGEAFTEDWSSEKVDPNRWYLFEKVWGETTNANGGAVPQNVKLETDTVQIAGGGPAVEKKVLALYANGGDYSGPVKGLQRNKSWDKKTQPISEKYQTATSGSALEGKLTGSGIVSAHYYGSGTYETVMKFGDDSSTGTTKLGFSPAIWTLRYEYHDSGVVLNPDKKTCSGDGTALNPEDPQYQPRYKQGDGECVWYSTVGSELDMPETGRRNPDLSFNHILFNAYYSEIISQITDIDLATKNIDLNDGQYHTFKTVWETERKQVPGSNTSAFKAALSPLNGLYYGANTDEQFLAYQGVPVAKDPDGYWYASVGKSAELSIDGTPILAYDAGEGTRPIPAVVTRFIIASWFASWAAAGPSDAPWETNKVRVSSVSFTPASDSSGDTTGQCEDYPTDGLCCSQTGTGCYSAGQSRCSYPGDALN